VVSRDLTNPLGLHFNSAKISTKLGKIQSKSIRRDELASGR
jgi:hypothetical protein